MVERQETMALNLISNKYEAVIQLVDVKAKIKT